MTGSMGNFRSELRMPAGPAAAAVMGASLLVVWYTKPHPLLMPLAAVAAVALLIDAWQPRLSAWLLLLALVALVTLAVTWQGLPEALALFFVPVGLRPPWPAWPRPLRWPGAKPSCSTSSPAAGRRSPAPASSWRR